MIHSDSRKPRCPSYLGQALGEELAEGYAKEPIMTQDARNRATAKYRKENVVSKTIRFYPAEAQLVKHLDLQDNVAGYIKQLIRDDMESAGRSQSS